MVVQDALSTRSASPAVVIWLPWISEPALSPFTPPSGSLGGLVSTAPCQVFQAYTCGVGFFWHRLPQWLSLRRLLSGVTELPTVPPFSWRWGRCLQEIPLRDVDRGGGGGFFLKPVLLGASPPEILSGFKRSWVKFGSPRTQWAPFRCGL